MGPERPKIRVSSGRKTLNGACIDGRISGLGGNQLRPRTVSRLSSIPQISSAVACPTGSPNRLTSTAPTCSTRTRVVSPSTISSGRKDAGRALVDVGAIKTTERGNNASAWTITPNRRPRCSWPIPFGNRNSYTSPRSTETLHQRGDLAHLLKVIHVRFQRSHFVPEDFLTSQRGGGVEDRLPNRLRSAHTGCFERVQSPLDLVVQPNRNCVCHESIVSRCVIHAAGRMPTPPPAFTL